MRILTENIHSLAINRLLGLPQCLLAVAESLLRGLAPCLFTPRPSQCRSSYGTARQEASHRAAPLELSARDRRHVTTTVPALGRNGR